MRFTTSILLSAVTLLGPAAAAIDASILTELPSCAQTPLISGVANSGCEVTNTDCICSNTELLSTLQSAVKSACSASDQEKTLELTGQICPGVAVSSAVATSATATETSEAAAPTTATPVPTDVPSATASLWTGTGLPTANLTATTGTYAAPSEPTVTPSTGAAAPAFQLGRLVSGVLCLGGLFAGL